MRSVHGHPPHRRGLSILRFYGAFSSHYDGIYDDVMDKKREQVYTHTDGK